MKNDLNKILRIIGFDSDSRGIMNRYINVDGAWDEHLNNSRKYVLQFLKLMKPRNLAVFGSGWLLDFPLHEASELTDNIYLCDLVHPTQILQKTKKYPNITTVNVDITGGVLSDVYESIQVYRETGFKPDFKSLCNKIFKPDFGYDCAVSLNILSQLGDLLFDYVSQYIQLTVDEKDHLLRILQQNHIELLSLYPACLITDIEEINYDRNDQVTGTKSLIKCSLPDGVNIRKWEWQFDPLGEYIPGLLTISTVVAMQLNNRK